MATKRKSDLQKRIERRAAAYERATAAIFQSVSGVIEGIEMYAREEELLTDDNVLEMLAVSLDEDTQFLFMVGMFKPNIGTVVMAPSGEQFPVETEEHRSMYAKSLRISVSPEIVEANDAETTLGYIKESNAKLQELMEQLQKQEVAQTSGDLTPHTPEVLTEEDKQDQDKLQKILEGATNPSGMFN